MYFVAVNRENTFLIRLLRAHGAEISALTMHRITSSKEEIASCLLSSGEEGGMKRFSLREWQASLSDDDRKIYRHVLFHCVRNVNLDVLRVLLQYDPVLDDDGVQALSAAFHVAFGIDDDYKQWYRHLDVIEMVKLLIGAGVDVAKRGVPVLGHLISYSWPRRIPFHHVLSQCNIHGKDMSESAEDHFSRLRFIIALRWKLLCTAAMYELVCQFADSPSAIQRLESFSYNFLLAVLLVILFHSHLPFYW